MHFQADAEVCVISYGTKNTPLRQLSLSILYLFDSIVCLTIVAAALHTRMLLSFKSFYVVPAQFPPSLNWDIVSHVV